MNIDIIHLAISPYLFKENVEITKFWITIYKDDTDSILQLWKKKVLFKKALANEEPLASTWNLADVFRSYQLS